MVRAANGLLTVATLLTLTALAANAQGSNATADENRPYEFGFNIEGYQHRHEKKDERGIIMGQFGFITADGYYRVTVYATDENGDFKILAMKSIKVGFPPGSPGFAERLRSALAEGEALSGGPSPLSPPRAGAPAAPSTARPPAYSPPPTSPQPSSLSSTRKPLVPNGCSHCVVPTTTTTRPPQQFPAQPSKAGAPFGGAGSIFPGRQHPTATLSGPQEPFITARPEFIQGLTSGSAGDGAGDGGGSSGRFGESPQFPVQTASPSVPTPPSSPTTSSVSAPFSGANEGNRFGSEPYFSTSPLSGGSGSGSGDGSGSGGKSVFGEGGGNGVNTGAEGNVFGRGGGKDSGFGGEVKSRGGEKSGFGEGAAGGFGGSPGSPFGVNRGDGSGSKVTFPGVGGNASGSRSRSNFGGSDFVNSGGDGGGRSESGFGGSGFINSGGDGGGGAGSGGDGFVNSRGDGGVGNGGGGFIDSIGDGGGGAGSGVGGGGLQSGEGVSSDRRPGSGFDRDGARFGNSESDGAGGGGIGLSESGFGSDGNRRDGAGIGEEREGLPPGVSMSDIMDLLYKFNYTTGFHGHHEQGYSNGNKEGGYFVNGNDGISRRVEYVANEFGYQPNLTLHDLGLNSPDTTRTDTEKEAGLKGYEFLWFPAGRKPNDT